MGFNAPEVYRKVDLKEIGKEINILTLSDMLWNIKMSVILIEQPLQKIRGTRKFGCIQIIYAGKNPHVFK